MQKLTYQFLALVFVPALVAAEAPPAKNMVSFDGIAVKNLRLQMAEAEETEFEETLFSLGRIEAIPSQRSGVSSRIPGRILELKVGLGDTVEAGAEVARLESRQAGDPPPVIALRAPRGGLVTKADIAEGEPLEPETTLMEITNLTEVYAIAHVPEHQAGKMKPGALAHIRVAALPDEKLEGELMRFGTETNRESGTVDAIFKLPNPKLTIRPGMRAEFSIVLSKRDGVLSVPRSALQGDAASRYVYVEDLGMLEARTRKLKAKKNTSPTDLIYGFVKTPVVVGQMNDRFVEIVSGVLVADSVVTEGAYSLSFAGGGTISLKAALDAAHGHEHNEDGTEKTAEQKQAEEAAKSGSGSGHGQSGGADDTLFWKIVCAVLALLLVISAVMKRWPQLETEAP